MVKGQQMMGRGEGGKMRVFSVVKWRKGRRYGRNGGCRAFSSYGVIKQGGGEGDERKRQRFESFFEKGVTALQEL
jgi:hypothetical protein